MVIIGNFEACEMIDQIFGTLIGNEGFDLVPGHLAEISTEVDARKCSKHVFDKRAIQDGEEAVIVLTVSQSERLEDRNAEWRAIITSSQLLKTSEMIRANVMASKNAISSCDFCSGVI
jgi:hypothetical protein